MSKKNYSREFGHANETKSKPVPPQVEKQRELCKKYKYVYKKNNDGKITDNSTLYIHSGVAHQSNIQHVFDTILKKVKEEKLFGDDFECDFRINLIKNYDNEYLGYAFVWLSNPVLYYALLGCNVDGTERVEYIQDPDWKPDDKIVEKKSWGDYDDDIPVHKKIELDSLIKLEDFKYELDEQQLEFMDDKTQKEGFLTATPGFILLNNNEELDATCLYVSNVPVQDSNLMYDIFSNYAKTPHYNSKLYFPKINVHKTQQNNIYAIVKFASENDASFAMLMTRKIRILYNGEETIMATRFAYKNT